MSLQKRFSIFLLSLLALYLIIIYVVLNNFVQVTFDSLQRSSAVDSSNRVLQAIDIELSFLETHNRDNSSWDIIYSAVLENNVEVLNIQINDVEFVQSLPYNLSQIYDAEGNLLSSIILDADFDKEFNSDDFFVNPIQPGNPIINHSDIESIVSGVLNTRLGPMLVLSLPILTSNFEGPIAGTMIEGFLLNHEKVEKIKNHIN